MCIPHTDRNTAYPYKKSNQYVAVKCKRQYQYITAAADTKNIGNEYSFGEDVFTDYTKNFLIFSGTLCNMY